MRFLKYFFLLLPFVGVLWVPFYAGNDPVVWGIPYFFWYQFLWVAISAALTAIVYFMDIRKERNTR